MFKTKSILISGIGDLTYVSDIIDGLILSSEKKGSYGEVFNLGCSDPIKINQLVEQM